MSTIRIAAVIPTYNNARTIRAMVEAVRNHIDDVIVVDDGGDAEARATLGSLVEEDQIRLVTRPANGGKGAAVKDGLREASRLGFTHALQIDADLQHDTNDIPKLVAEATAHPDALVLAVPVFRSDAPKGRLFARQITVFWTNVETGGRKIADPMCGFRIYPLAEVARVHVHGNRMDFDPEIAVRLVWNGVEVRSVPSEVRYIPADEGGVSHFRMFHDNVLISLMHSRLCIEGLGRALGGAFGVRK